ncbi:MAG: hypothetical protein COB49_12645 [Alphaproteobacteria bacterium]|nr:MAG: hypothetical protein COB49_12645 [Alphaproteobacteria bacterium]
MRVPVGRKNEKVLREALDRLITGRSERTNGRLTVANLAREAGLSRATANRADTVLVEFRRAVAAKANRQKPQQSVKYKVREQRDFQHVLNQHVQARAIYQMKLQRDVLRVADNHIIAFKRRDNKS